MWQFSFILFFGRFRFKVCRFGLIFKRNFRAQFSCKKCRTRLKKKIARVLKFIQYFLSKCSTLSCNFLWWSLKRQWITDITYIRTGIIIIIKILLYISTSLRMNYRCKITQLRLELTQLYKYGIPLKLQLCMLQSRIRWFCV